MFFLIVLISIFDMHAALANEPAEESVIQTTMPMGPGTRLEFRASATDHPMRPMVEENFVLEILETWTAGITFKYEVNQKVLGTETGIQTLSSLDTCTTLDPWWDPGETSFDDRCEFWIPAKVYRELLVNHKSYLSIDTLARRDSVVRWEQTGKTHFSVEINGRPVLVEALVVHTSRNDDIMIWNNPANPLILAIQSTYFAWELKSVSN